MDDSAVSLIATTAFGLEAVVSRELTALGYEPKTTQPGRVEISADLGAICRLNLHLRCSERVLIRLGQFEADDFDKLFDGVAGLPWEDWIPVNGQFPVRGRSVKSQLSSVPACQRMVKKAIAKRLLEAHDTPTLDETGPLFQVEVALLNNIATLTIDTTGPGLHKRGYRPIAGKAPLRETLAAALVLLSFWKPDRPLIDPFCGTGTIPIEAAMIGRNIAPGMRRQFTAESWSHLPATLWDSARSAAEELVSDSLPIRIRGMDIHEGALKLARRNAEAAGVADDIHFQNKPFSELSSKREFGCLITNPPYGLRLGQERETRDLYRSMPDVFRKLPTWSHYVITAFPDFEKQIGQRANRRRKLYNGRIECQYYQFHGPQPPKNKTPNYRIETDVSSDKESPTTKQPPAFGGLRSEADRQATEFANRLKKRARHLRKWPARGIQCYRLYERDIPEIPLVVDRYDNHLHIAEFARPHDRTPAEHGDWLDLMKTTAAQVLEIPKENVFTKFRDRQRGTLQYERVADSRNRLTVQEGGLQFLVNLSDYVDTGLFLDHRITRDMVRREAAGCDVVNLFSYTGSFSVYAADGGANSTTSVDLSRTYLDWAGENMRLNGFTGQAHRYVQSDALGYLAERKGDACFDLAIVDPPTFSNSKRTEHDWETQRDHPQLLLRLMELMRPGGTIYFSNNYRRFKFQLPPTPGWDIVEISAQTVPQDFRNRRIHRCWKIHRR